MPFHYFLPDNTVLINFSILKRHDLLGWFVRGQGAWTAGVALECDSSARRTSLDMAPWSEIFGTPLMPTRAERIDALIIADGLRKPGDAGYARHMGEAESIAIIRNRGMRAVFLTDDHDAARAAATHSIVVASSTKILAVAAAMDRLTHQDARQCLADLLNQDRVLGDRPSVHEFDSEVERLRASRPGGSTARQ